ncbi:MAG: ATP-binding cassette domain-containing protein [Proteobacteria bacterium]|nr:ATP-binding cassette domain-containing protein [Pseudomonadota bacterium]MBU1232553.1 ATP-binding cassette domain-containing protein [Pseudomonadota bacterium]MBU1418009.1 ATP-binding cassette domain-containing protein [Pseudomonadota bacterium]MBU1455940.1 ATP-binding cassette domain-containing protein [Pseudomonadota bacterium]
MTSALPLIDVQDLTMAYGDFILQQNLTFSIAKGTIFAIMGESGCGKSTLLKHMIGLKRPAIGTIHYYGKDFWKSSPQEQIQLLQKAGILYQSGALWSSMTVGDNIALPLQQFTDLSPKIITELVALKLALVGLKGFADYFPSEISGGMRKRAGLARAMALDPDILFFDEPSAGLDPISSKSLDDLILQLRDSLGATIVMVTHELPSIFALADDSVFLDTETRTMLTTGNPKILAKESDITKVRQFLSRNALSPEKGLQH